MPKYIINVKDEMPIVQVELLQEDAGVVLMVEGNYVLRVNDAGTLTRFSGVANDAGLKLDKEGRVVIQNES